MANRGMSATVLTEIVKEKIRIVTLVEIFFDAGTERFSDGLRDMTYASNNYESNGNYLRVSTIRETIAPAIQTITIEMSGVPLANLSQILSIKHIDRKVIVRRGFQSSSASVFTDPIILFTGRLNGWTFTEDPGSGTAIIVWTANNHWGGDRDRVSGRMANQKDQETHFPTDKFFEFIGVNNSKPLRWGSKDSGGGPTSLLRQYMK